MQNNDFFTIFKLHLLEIINLFKNVSTRITNIIRFFILIFFIFIVFIYMSFSFIIFTLNIFYLSILFLYKYFYIKHFNVNVDTEFVIKNEHNNVFNNDVLIYLKIIFIDIPLNYSFLYFYNILNFFIGNKNKKQFNLKFLYNIFISFILKRIVLILTTFTYLNLKLAFNLFISFFDLLSYPREDWYAFISHLLYNISSNLVWSINNEIFGKKIYIRKNSVSLNGFSWETFFKNLGNRVGKKPIYDFYESCKKIKVESNLVYGVTTIDEKKPHPKFKIDIVLNDGKEINNLLKKIDLDHQNSKNLDYNTKKNEFEYLDPSIKAAILSNNGTTNPNFYLKNSKNSYVKNTGPFEGTIDSSNSEFITPAQITDKREFKLLRIPKSMVENIYKVDLKAKFLSTLIYDIQTDRIYEHDGKEFKEIPLNVFINKLNSFDNDNATSAIYNTIDFSQRLSLSCESLEERDFYLKNVNQAFSNPELVPFFEKISVTYFFGGNE